VQAGALDRFPIRLNRKAIQLFNLPHFLRKTGSTPDRVRGRLFPESAQSMIPKSGYRFSEKIMLKQ